MKLFITYLMIFLVAGLSAQSTGDELALNSVNLSNAHLLFDTLPIAQNQQKPLDFIYSSNKEKFDSHNYGKLFASNYLNIYSDGEFRASFNITSGSYLQESDARGKKEVREVKNGALQKLLQLEPITFLMKNQENENRSVGLIAQDVREVFPALVQYIDEEEVLALSYIELIPILIKAIQEQQGVIQNLKENQFVMQKEFAAFQQQLAQLLERLSAKEAFLQNDVALVAQN